MLDWRRAESVAALTAEGPSSEALGIGAPLVEPARASLRAARDTAGELRVLSYGERSEPPPAPPPEVAPTQPIAPTPDATGEWSMVATSELRAFGTGELVALSAHEPSPAETSEWSAVLTSELRAFGSSELPVLVTDLSSAQATLSELRAVATRDKLPDAALPSVIVSAETSTELPSFAFRAEQDAPRARGAMTPTPRALPVYNAAPAGPPPGLAGARMRALRFARARMRALRSHAPVLVMGSLLVLSACALGVSLTLRLLRAPELQISQERAYPRAPLPPQPMEQPPFDPVPAPPAAALPAAETSPASEPFPPAATDDAMLAEPAREGATRSREVGGGRDTGAAHSVDRVRITAASAKVRAGNDVEAQVVCSLPRDTVRPVVATLPGTTARWFAVRCDARAVGWVQESDLALVAR
jgi:hypothetical protein